VIIVVRRSIVAVGWAVVVVVWLVVVVVVAALLVDGGTFLAIKDAGQKPSGGALTPDHPAMALLTIQQLPQQQRPDNADPYPHHGPVKGGISSEQAGRGGGGGGGGVHLYYNGITIHCLPFADGSCSDEESSGEEHR